jgi:ribose transport system substrate-binding protein
MMRRCRAVLLVLAMVVGVSGCGDQSSNTGDTVLRVGFLPQNTKANYAVEMADGFRAGVQRVDGVEAAVVAPDVLDGPTQLAMFKNLTGQPIDSVAVHTAFGDLFAGPMADSVKRGVPVISVDSRPPPSSNVEFYIGNDNYQLGQLLADQIIGGLPANATGTVVLGSTTPGTYALDRRGDGMRAKFRERLPGVKVIGPFETKRDPKVNMSTWTTLIKANPKALAFLGTGNFDAVSLGSLRIRTKGKWLAGAFDLEQAALAAVKSGDLVLVSPEHYLKGSIAGRLMADHAKNGDDFPKGWLYVPGLAITAANIDAILARQATPEAKAAYINPQVDKIIKDPASLRPL